MQHKLKRGDLLNENGELVEAGYATSLVKAYDRKKIKANKMRIKEWDYYLIYNNDFGVALTIDDNSYMAMNSFTLLNFKNQTETTKSFMHVLTNGKTNFPATSKSGNVSAKHENYTLEFLNNGKARMLKVWIKNFENGNDLSGEFMLFSEPKDSMVIATPFAEKKTHFYYNQKIVGFKVKGKIVIGKKVIEFDEPTRAILDWGRGVWTYKNTWYWGAGAGIVNGKEVGFNIGYGFGDTSAASENMLFVDGKAHKLENVTFNIPTNEKGKEEFLKPWTFSSSDGRFEMNFEPVIDRHSNANVVVISSNQHQVFGKFSGIMILDDGSKLEIKDFLGFAEKVVNKW